MVALSQDSDSDLGEGILVHLAQRQREHKVSEAKVATMTKNRLLELEFNRRRDEERDELQKQYDEFVREVEQRNGKNCHGHLAVFCGYMRLGREDPETAHYRDKHSDLKKQCSCRYRTMDPGCKLRAVCKADWDLLAKDIADTKAGLCS